MGTVETSLSMKQFIPLFSCLGLSSALKANCVFDGIAGSSQVVGEVTLTETETPDGTEIEIAGELINLSPGLHGFHIHENGDLSDNCKGAGGHYNPAAMNHGAPGAEDRHVGDLGNIAVSDDEIAVVRIEDHLVKLRGDTSVIGEPSSFMKGRMTSA